jgi:hypothetical protein
MSTRLLLAALLLAPLAPAGPDEGPDAPKAPTMKAPKGWKTDKPDALGITSARFSIGEGDAAVFVVVTGLKGDGGGAAVNVNRWRAQVGLKALDDEAAKKALRPAKVGDLEGHSFDVSGPGGEARRQTRILTAFVKHGGSTWYFRMSGPADKVKEQKDNFDAFLKSTRFAIAEK